MTKKNITEQQMINKIVKKGSGARESNPVNEIIITNNASSTSA